MNEEATTMSAIRPRRALVTGDRCNECGCRPTIVVTSTNGETWAKFPHGSSMSCGKYDDSSLRSRDAHHEYVVKTLQSMKF